MVKRKNNFNRSKTNLSNSGYYELCYVRFKQTIHAYDADKIDKGIVVRNSKKGETFTALDNKDYKLEEDMCVISDNTGVLV